MKTKLLACALIVCFFLLSLCSCGIAENTVQTTQTTQTAQTTSTTPQYAFDWAFPIIDVHNLDELLAELKTSEADIAEVINTNGTLYYPEVKAADYELISINGSGTEIVYYFEHLETYTELGEAFMIIFDYKNQELDDVVGKSSEYQERYEIISDSSIYDKKLRIIYFTYANGVHSIYTVENCTERNWQNFIEIKSIDVNQ